jgi:hypothetical protein
MNCKTIPYLLLFLVLTGGRMLSASDLDHQSKYHNISEVQLMLEKFRLAHADKCRLHNIAVSPGGENVTVLEIGSDQTDVPAIFAGANFEGNIPVATEGALRLARMLLDSAQYTTGLKWYILPQPNPDAAKGYFSVVKYNRTVNDFDVNNDGDELLNEDGFEDLNGDGFITQMRVKSLDGTHIAANSDPRIMVRADAGKGERGEYKMYSEGMDKDGDGQLNEDGEGGINVGIAFPHRFPKKNKQAGVWPGQTPEVYGILRFIFDHPEITMVYTLGSSDFCLFPPKGEGEEDFNPDRIKIPSRYARMLQVDENQTYTMNEAIELLKEHMPPGTEVTPAMVLEMTGSGPIVNPLEDDLKFYAAFSEEYEEYLKSNNFPTDNLVPEPAKDGSFELWAYFHLGVPSFSMNLFSIPGENKKEGEGSDKEKGIKPKEAEQLSREQTLLAWSDKVSNGNGFVEWGKYDHPEFGEVEIGGFVPYFENTPNPGQMDSLLALRLPWLLKLTRKLPAISIADEHLTPMGSGVYKLDLFIENEGFLPYPTAMGQRNGQPAPVVIVLDGDFELLEGVMRTPLRAIGGNQVKKLSWLIRTDRKTEISAVMESAVFGKKMKQIKIGE